MPEDRGGTVADNAPREIVRRLFQFGNKLWRESRLRPGEHRSERPQASIERYEQAGQFVIPGQQVRLHYAQLIADEGRKMLA